MSTHDDETEPPSYDPGSSRDRPDSTEPDGDQPVGENENDAPVMSDPTAPGSAEVEEVPLSIGKYRVVGRLDKGGRGRVYRVLHPNLPGEMVLKIAREPMSLNPSVRGEFLEEGQLLARLKHPNLARVIDLDFHDDRPFLVLEYVPGRTLQRYAEETRPKPSEAARLIAELAGAVDYLHRQGVIHQDIKPRNVLIEPDGTPRLIDFGLARLREAWSDESSGLTGGTPAFMAPEQASGRQDQIGPQTDVFGLGAALYFLLTGQPLYEGSSQVALLKQAREANITSPRRLNPRVPRALERICLKALDREPSNRHQTAADLRRALRRFLVRPKVLALSSGAIVLALVSGTLLAARNHGQPPEALRIVAFEVEHFRGDRPEHLGTLGITTRTARVDDDVRVHARLTAPAYCYLLALNPDGGIELRYPAKATTQPPPSAEVTYPLDPTVYFGLTDGSGLQAFALVASRKPLPPFAQWEPGGALPWTCLAGEPDGVWLYDGQWFHPLPRPTDQRGQERRKSEPPRPFADVCQFLKAQPEVDAMQALAFPVKAD
jgi:predicted Ser/Thr protein kinase